MKLIYIYIFLFASVNCLHYACNIYAPIINPVQSQIINTDDPLIRSIMTEFYYALDGDNWINRGYWLSEYSVCGWGGIKCQDNNIVGLNIEYNRLRGELPSRIALLTNLTDVALACNYISSGLQHLALLPELRNIWFFSNGMSGTIPEFISKKFQSLSMNNNNFTGTLPKMFESITTLEAILLSNNMLEGPIVDLSKSTGITVIEIFNNKLSGTIPPHMFQYMTQLSHLSLDHNQLSGNLPDMYDQARLTTISLSHNNFSGIIPQSFYSLPLLSNMDLSYNSLYGPIVNLRYLRGYINLSHNKFSGSVDTNGIFSIHSLDLSYNNLSGNIHFLILYRITIDIRNNSNMSMVVNNHHNKYIIATKYGTVEYINNAYYFCPTLQNSRSNVLDRANLLCDPEYYNYEFCHII